jgi:hypothetical protein
MTERAPLPRSVVARAHGTDASGRCSPTPAARWMFVTVMQNRGPFTGSATKPIQKRSRYAPLSDFLRDQRGDVVTLTFREIDAMLAADLPPSARRHSTWWSNQTYGRASGRQCRAWMDVGWRTTKLDLPAERVTFRRGCHCDSGWVCEQHRSHGWPHDDCPGPGMPCQRCNPGDPPTLPRDWRSHLRND